MSIITQSEEFVKNLFKDKLSSSYSYHNIEHTSMVIASLHKLIEEENVSEEDSEVLIVAGWFHDIGFIKGCENHENCSIKIVNQFLENQDISQDKKEKIESLILATQLNYKPQNKLEEIIRDADCSHLGNAVFSSCTDNLRKELRNVHSKKYSKLDWAKINAEFFNKHQFYTNYAKENWGPIKEQNLKNIMEEIQLLEVEKREKEDSEKSKSLLNKKKLEKLESPERGIETMFRVTLNNHTKLSQIADSKANILLSVNSIIISVALSTLVPKLDSPSNAHLIIPTFIMIINGVVCIIFSIMSTRPKVTSGTFTRDEIKKKKVNLLFFGNFHKMPVEEYIWAMKEMMNDRTYLYEAMIKDLYYLGLVLDRKYKLLRITYTIFTIGIVVSVLAFGIAFYGIMR